MGRHMPEFLVSERKRENNKQRDVTHLFHSTTSNQTEKMNNKRQQQIFKTRANQQASYAHTRFYLINTKTTFFLNLPILF